MDTTYTNVVDASTSQIASDTKFHVAGLDLYYDKFHALKDINIDIPEKQITAFIGPSGCGKSTFLKSLNRMNDLVEGCRITGEVKLGEQDIYGDIDINHLRKRVGMVFQNPNPFPMSIYDNIAYGPRTHGIHSKQKLDVIVEKSLRQAAIWDELKDRLKKSALGLSGGQHYERDGKYQLYASEIELSGRGDLYLRFEKLLKELEEIAPGRRAPSTVSDAAPR